MIKCTKNDSVRGSVPALGKGAPGRFLLIQSIQSISYVGKGIYISSLAYLLSTGLTPWNFDSACLSFIIHSISFILDPFICSTRFNFMFVI